MLTYPSYVNGRDVPSDRYVYTVTTRSLLEDVFSSLTLKRRLENGEDVQGEELRHVVGRCAVADDDVVRDAVEAAAVAAREWSATPLDTRVRVVRGIRERLRRGRADLVDVLVQEGTPRALAQWQVSGMVEASSEETVSWCAGQLWQEFEHGPRRLVIRRMADGVVCVNPPQNAPAASALFATSALLSGNALVIRAPRSAPLGVMHILREYVVPELEAVGAPPGVLNVFCSRPGPALRAWLDSPLVDDIFFTGSVEKGLELEAACVARGKKPILELAGNDCVVVWRDADLDLAVEALVECFYGSGQICMVPNQVVVHPAVADELLAKLTAAVARLRPGYPEDEGVMLSPVLRAERFFAQVGAALAGGARLVFGGRRLEVDGTPSDTGLFLEPTVLRVDGLASSRDIEVVREETFFPVLPVVVPESTEDDTALLRDVIEFVNSNRYGLRNSLWAGDDGVVDEFVRRVSNGGLLKVNDSHIGFVPYLPTHGGTGLTGGAFGEANYLALRTSHLQGVSVARGVRPSAAVLDGYTALGS